MTSIKRQITNAFEPENSSEESIEVLNIRTRFPHPPLLRRCDDLNASLDCSALNMSGLFQIYNTVNTTKVVYCEEDWDYSWWNENEEDWDVYDAYDHLSDEEYADYLFDRSLSL